MKPAPIAIIVGVAASAQAATPAADLAGQWVRVDGKPLGLLISQTPDGLWVVKSFGAPRATPATPAGSSTPAR